MKQAIITVPFYLNKINMSSILDNRILLNYDDIHNSMLKKINKIDRFFAVYKSRNIWDIQQSEYPNINDTIIGKVVKYNDGTIPSLDIECYDSLYYCKLINPVVKINGYCHIDDNTIILDELTRITIGEG